MLKNKINFLAETLAPKIILKNILFFQVVVDESARGTGLGRILVSACTRLSEKLGVYKVIK